MSSVCSADTVLGPVILEEAPPQQANPKHWFNWTMNSTVGSHNDIIKILEPKCTDFCFQLERGEETGYLHYQGVMRTKERTRWSAVRKWMPEGTHLEETRSWKAQWTYCQKAETAVEGPWKLDSEAAPKWEVAVRSTPVEWYPWQNEVLQWARGLPDERSVLWVYDAAGRSGKTTLGHELCKNYGGVPVNGKLGDVLALATERSARLYLIVAPRDQSANDFPYAAIEMLKDGLWMKGKYEVDCVVRSELVHVIVLANCLPIYEKLTHDRWKTISV